MQVTKCDKCEQEIKIKKKVYGMLVTLRNSPAPWRSGATEANVEYCEKCLKEDCPPLIRGMLPSL